MSRALSISISDRPPSVFAATATTIRASPSRLVVACASRSMLIARADRTAPPGHLRLIRNSQRHGRCRLPCFSRSGHPNIRDPGQECQHLASLLDSAAKGHPLPVRITAIQFLQEASHPNDAPPACTRRRMRHGEKTPNSGGLRSAPSPQHDPRQGRGGDRAFRLFEKNQLPSRRGQSARWSDRPRRALRMVPRKSRARSPPCATRSIAPSLRLHSSNPRAPSARRAVAHEHMNSPK